MAVCLSMRRYTELVGFAKSTGLRLVFGLNAIAGRGRGAAGGTDDWRERYIGQRLDLANIRALLLYTAAHHLDVYAFQLGNEMTQYQNLHDDFVRLRALINSIWRSAATRPLLVGHDQNLETVGDGPIMARPLSRFM